MKIIVQNMEDEYVICVECDDLQASLVEKDKEIQRLKLHIKNLTNFLLWSKKNHEKNSDTTHKSPHNDENKYKYQSEGLENDISSTDLINLSCDMLKMSRNYSLESKSVQTDVFENQESVATGTDADFESENVDDYVYDYNYQMYYSASTGYYYDDKTGLTYDPQTCTYYRYNYDKKVYEMVPQQESTSSSEANNYVNDAVLDKVNSLNLNDESLNGEESTSKIKSVVSNISEKSMDENEVSETNDSEQVIRAKDSAGLTEDWQCTEGSMLSVKDMVKQVVDDYNNVSDYTYDETYQMYYSQSTGFYYDSVRKLLYDPYSGTYYSFDEDTQKYEFHSQVDPNLSNTKKIQVLKCSKNKLRKKFKNFAKKKKDLNTNSQVNANKISDSNFSNSNSEVNVNVPISCAVGPKTSENEDSLSRDCVNDTSNQTDPNSSDKEESSVNKDPLNTERLKIREKYWKKKLEHADQSSTSPMLNDPIYDEISDDEIVDEDFSSPEEGEVFSSEGESEAPVSIVRSPVLGASNNQKNEPIPPSIRAIVENSEKLKIGSLILITCSGGVIGRNKNNAIYIPDTSISKFHAQIKFSAEDQTYSIHDLGSQNGTFVNDKRLSEPKIKSESCTLNHGDKLSLGFFKVLLHIHEGYETCDNCEPGQVIAEISSKSAKILVRVTKEDREQQRREELKRLKKKYGLQGAIFERKIQLHLKTGTTGGYEDKAEIRRQTVGSDNPYEKTQEASVDLVMPESNKGYQMLKKMGWKEGQSLGATDSGLTEPIPFRPWTTKAGLGSSDLPFSVVPEDKRTKRWVKAQERYFQLSLGGTVEPPS